MSARRPPDPATPREACPPKVASRPSGYPQFIHPSSSITKVCKAISITRVVYNSCCCAPPSLLLPCSCTAPRCLTARLRNVAHHQPARTTRGSDSHLQLIRSIDLDESIHRKQDREVLRPNLFKPALIWEGGMVQLLVDRGVSRVSLDGSPSSLRQLFNQHIHQLS